MKARPKQHTGASNQVFFEPNRPLKNSL